MDRPSRQPLRRHPSQRLAGALLALGVLVAADPTLATAPERAASSPAALAAGPDDATTAARWAQVDALVRLGYDRPDEALSALDAQLAAVSGASPAWRDLMRGRGLVAADVGRADVALAAVRSLLDAAATAPAASGEPALARADAALAQAVLADAQAQPQAAAELARGALSGYEQACLAVPAGCDPRLPWLANHLLARQYALQGRVAQARPHAQRAVDLARADLGVNRQVLALAQAATLGARAGDIADAVVLWDRAQRLATLDGSPWLLAELAVLEYGWQVQRGNEGQLRLASERGLLHARRAASPRLQARLLVNLSDAHLRERQPALALAAVDKALPLARAAGSRRAELVLLANAALARIALRQFGAAAAALDELLAGHEASGAATDQVAVLREFGDAFAAVGQMERALALYHRERELTGRLLAADRGALLADLGERFGREAQQRRLAQLEREHELLAVQLANRDGMRRVWAGGAAAVALAMLLVVLLYRRVRRANRHLEHNRALLHALSQRDPLTGLANRRALREVIGEQGLHDRFAGTLMLLDIDHFKRVNDTHGHTVGDVVLMEVAGRLAEVVRGDDLVVRWGGEEFLVFVPRIQPAQAQDLAVRALQAIGGTPVRLPDGGRLWVTASAGYAAFPVGPTRLPLPLERAIHLVDMALYAAKSQGRNRAVGLDSVVAEDEAALARVEADFDRACLTGLVALRRSAGPVQALPANVPSVDLSPQAGT